MSILIHALFAISLAKTPTVCTNAQSIVAAGDLQLSVCLLRNIETGPVVGVRYQRKNVSSKPIRVYIQEGDRRLDMKLQQYGETVFTRTEWFFDVDTPAPVPVQYKLVQLDPNQTHTDQLMFKTLRKALTKSSVPVNLDGDFTIWFATFPSFMREGEDLSQHEAWKKRRADEKSRELLEDYENIRIKWR
jgi:hypothetical protein